jgi:hypothetical protein
LEKLHGQARGGAEELHGRRKAEQGPAQGAPTAASSTSSTPPPAFSSTTAAGIPQGRATHRIRPGRVGGGLLFSRHGAHPDGRRSGGSEVAGLLPRRDARRSGRASCRRLDRRARWPSRSPPRPSSSLSRCRRAPPLPLLCWPRSGGRGPPPRHPLAARTQGRRRRAPLHARDTLPPGGRQLPLRMCFGLHDTAGSYLFLRVGYILFPTAYQWVTKMQTGHLLEMV